MTNLNLTELTFNSIKSRIETYLKEEYAKSNIVYSVSSPYGQILYVVQMLFQLSLIYLKNTIKQYDLSDVNSNNIKLIRTAAILAGHIPSRAASATGVLKFSIKTSVDISTSIPGNRITFTNRQQIKNKTNGLKYAFNIGTDKITYKIDSNSAQLFMNIIQGEWKTEPFTGDGTINQTFQLVPRGNKQDIENYNVNVLVNGVYWEVKKHIFQLLPDEQACVVRTGFAGGIDIIFGNGGYGAIPPVASNILINYLLTDGNNGNIYRKTPNDWTFIDLAIDGNGNTIDVSNLFDITIFNDIDFGADQEDPTFTKNILGISHNNFILALPEHYAYAIKKLGLFSYVNAYELYGSIYIVVAPNVSLYKSKNSDYFSIPLSAFQISSNDATKIDTYLKAGGNIMLTKRYHIVSPAVSLYAINVFYITYSDSQDDSVNTQIYDAISNYFLSFNRTNRIPKVELIKAISAISDIHSVDINFVSKKNEDYHRKNTTSINNLKSTAAGSFQLSSAQQMVGYTASQVIGIDNVLGDILFEANEIPIIRGGWYDRNNNYYNDDNNSTGGLKSVNLFKKGTVDPSKKPNY
jgi:hypothetical protein